MISSGGGGTDGGGSGGLLGKGREGSSNEDGKVIWKAKKKRIGGLFKNLSILVCAAQGNNE